MPELPDVQVFKQYLDATSLHQKIKEVQVQAPEILKGVTASKLKEALSGHAFESSRRYGKYLLVQLDYAAVLVLHFGMTGFLKYFKDMEKKPGHQQLLISFSSGYHLAYDCQRKLGEVGLYEDEGSFFATKKLGKDALDIDFNSFKDILSASRASVKSALTNQDAIAGIGNIYSDEILFQGRIHPKKKARRLDDNALRRLFEVMKEVLAESIEWRADPDNFPDSYALPHRRTDRECPRCGGKMKAEKVSGRTSYFCPQCQN